MKIGTIVHYRAGDDLNEKIANVKKYGLESLQLVCWEPKLFTNENADLAKQAATKYGLTISAFWCGWSGPTAWNFIDGYRTLGLVPRAYRAARVEELKRGSDFAKRLGVEDVVTHFGFLPENPETDEYEAVVAAIKEVAEYCKKNGQYLLFETGQETPITVLRTINRVGTGNLGVNLDPANLLLYGKGNPCDSLDVFGKFVRGVHAKDGEYPTNGDYLGEEKRIGDGRVNFPVLIKKLRELGYNGHITIEREIEGEKQIEDIIYAKKFLREIING